MWSWQYRANENKSCETAWFHAMSCGSTSSIASSFLVASLVSQQPLCVAESKIFATPDLPIAVLVHRIAPFKKQQDYAPSQWTLNSVMCKTPTGSSWHHVELQRLNLLHTLKDVGLGLRASCLRLPPPCHCVQQLWNYGHFNAMLPFV